MKSKPLWRRVVRYFGPRATSVSPKIEPGWHRTGLTSGVEGSEEATYRPPIEPWGQMKSMSVSYQFDGSAGRIEPTGSTMVCVLPGETPADAMQRFFDGGGRPEDIPGWGNQRIADAPSIPSQAGILSKRLGIEPPANEMPWPDWRKLEAELDPPPGWSACRFPTWRAGDAPGENAGTCAFVFGITRGDFGIWRSPFTVCFYDDGGMHKGQREDVLAAVTHLPSGLGMGLFADRAAAVADVLIIERLADWRFKEFTIEAYAGMQQARTFAGITVCRDRHAHIGGPDGMPAPIWEQRAETMAAGRPEKLS